MNSITVLGVRVDDVTMPEALARVDEFMQEPRLHQIVTVNPEFIMAAQKDAAFAEALADSDLNLPDGANLLRAAQAQGTPLRERVAGTDFIWYLSGLAATAGWKVFLLGGRDGVGGRAAARMPSRRRRPRPEAAGTERRAAVPASSRRRRRTEVRRRRFAGVASGTMAPAPDRSMRARPAMAIRAAPAPPNGTSAPSRT